MVFVRSGWLCDRLSLTFNEAEVVALTADSPHGEFLVCAVYRPPNKNIALFLDELSAFLNKHSNKQIILAGDFNIDITDTSKTGVNDYLTLLAGYGFENQIQDFTREEILSDRLTQTCIDHISTRTPKLDAFGWVVKEKVADHYFTVLVISGDNRLPPVEPELEKLVLRDKEVDRQIKSFNWDALLESNHLVAYDLMAKKFEDIYNKSKKKIKLRRRNVASPWIDKEIMELSYQKGVLFKQCRKNPDNTLLKDEFKQLRNKLTAKIRLARKRYYLNQFSACRNNVKKNLGHS